MPSIPMANNRFPKLFAITATTRKIAIFHCDRDLVSTTRLDVNNLPDAESACRIFLLSRKHLRLDCSIQRIGACHLSRQIYTIRANGFMRLVNLASQRPPCVHEGGHVKSRLLSVGVAALHPWCLLFVRSRTSVRKSFGESRRSYRSSRTLSFDHRHQSRNRSLAPNPYKSARTVSAL